MSSNDEEIMRRLAVIESKFAELQMPAMFQAMSIVAQSLNNLEARQVAIEDWFRHTSTQNNQALMRNIQQTVNLSVRRMPLGRRVLRCLFIVHNVEAWDAYADVYEAMRMSEEFEPVVATVHRWLSSGPLIHKDEHINHEEMQRLGIKHIRLNMEDSFEGLEIIKAMAPDIIFRQAPWDNTLPPGFAAEQLNFARLCYVPYGYMMVRHFEEGEDKSLDHSRYHTDQLYHRLCWRIFCETEMHKHMFEQSSVRVGTNVVCSGYPKFDRLMRARSRTPFWPIASKSGKPFRLIWAPHHSLEAHWLNFSTFLDIYNDMLDWVKREPNIEFVLKPHPGLFPKLLDKNLLPPEIMENFIGAWKALPNAALVEGTDYGPLFQASDAMLTDGVSFLTEYPLFEKPLVFLDNQRNGGFNEAGKVALEVANTVHNLADAQALINALRKGGPDPKAGVRPSVIQRIRPHPDQSVKIILDSIRKGMELENGAQQRHA